MEAAHTYQIHKSTGETETFVGTFDEVAWKTFLAHANLEYDSVVTDSLGTIVCTRGEMELA